MVFARQTTCDALRQRNSYCILQFQIISPETTSDSSEFRSSKGRRIVSLNISAFEEVPVRIPTTQCKFSNKTPKLPRPFVVFLSFLCCMCKIINFGHICWPTKTSRVNPKAERRLDKEWNSWRASHPYPAEFTENTQRPVGVRKNVHPTDCFGLTNCFTESLFWY